MVLSLLHLLVACSLWSTVHSFIVDYSDALPCDSVGVAWTRDSASETQQFAFPLFLNIVPINSTPLIQQIPNWDQATNAGSGVVKFPFLTNVSFILGVTDSEGRGVGKASSIRTAVGNNTTCSSSQTTEQLPGGLRFFTAQDHSCPSVGVNWTNASNPSIFIFAPGHTPFTLTNGTEGASGSLKTPHGIYTSVSEVIVLFKDQLGSYTSDRLQVGGQDKTGCASESVSTSSNFSITSYHPHIANLIIGFVIAGVAVLFAAVFLLFWSCRRRGKFRDIENVPPPSPSSSLAEVEKVSPATSSPSVSMRTDRDPTEPLQISAVETTSENSYQIISPRGRRPNLQVIVPPLPVIPPVPPVPESVKTGSGSTPDPPDTAKTDSSSSRGRGILKKQNTPDRKRLRISKVVPTSYSLTPRRSSKSTLRKASLISDITVTTEDNFTLPDIEPRRVRPDSPTVPAMYLESKRSSRKLRRSKSLLSNNSSRRSHRDYKMLQDEGVPIDAAKRVSRWSMQSRGRSQSLPRSES